MIRPFSFADVLFIAEAIRWTIALSAIAFAGGAIGGLLIALARTSDIRWLRTVAMLFIRLFQGTPLLMQLFLVFFGLNIFGLPINPWLAASLALTLHASAFLGEIWRGCIRAIPGGQWEAGRALGLHFFSLMRFVILPQAWKIAVPPTVGYLVQVLKGTSLAAIIGFTEVTRAGQIVNNVTFQPLITFATVGAVYFALCWPLSLLARRLELRLKRATAR